MKKKKPKIFLISFLIIIIINQIIINKAIVKQASDAETINIAGKQRMYSQQITKLVIFNSEFKDKYPNNNRINILDSIFKQFTSAHNYLKKKNKLEYKSNTIDSLFQVNKPFYNNITSSFKVLQKNPFDETQNRNFIDVIISNEGPFLKSMDIIVSEYQKISQKRSEFLKIMQFIFIGFTSLSFLVMILFMLLPVFNENKELSVLIDKLEEFKNEVELKENEKRKIEEILFQTNSIARIGTWHVDLINQKVTWSKVTKEIHEVENDFEPTLEDGLNFYLEGYNREKITRIFNNSIQNKTNWDEELQIKTKKENLIWIRTIGKPEIIDGNCVGVFGTFQDINTTKTSQIELNIKNEELSAILNSGNICLIRTNVQGKITYFNEGAENLLGYKKEELLNKVTPIIFHEREELLKRGKELSLTEENIMGFGIFKNLAVEKREDFKNWTYIKKDGSSLYVQLSINELKDNNKNVVSYLIVGTDITKITEQNQQLANFAQIASHNLRAPVSNLNSLLDLFDISNTTEEKKQAFDKFRLVINHLTETLNSLIKAIEIKQKKESEIAITTLSFSKSVKKNTEILSETIKKLNAEIITDFSITDTINYNESYLESIIFNLLSNSLKYSSPDKKPKIEIRSALKDGKTQLIFKDNGLGIDLNKNGHKLFGLNNVFHRNKDSRGVGLYIVKNQINSLKGNISCNSEVNKGTEFIITF